MTSAGVATSATRARTSGLSSSARPARRRCAGAVERDAQRDDRSVEGGSFQQDDCPDGFGGQTLTEGIADHRTPPPEEALLNKSETNKIVRILKHLDDRESTILRMRYGLDGKEQMTLKEIGVKIKLTRERVRQIEGEALRKIKEHLED